MQQHIIFKFTFGFGNRLCNLMNMFYIHEKYPEALIYIIWIKNNHCDIDIHDIFDLTSYKYILSCDEYYNNVVPKYKSTELWATTSINERTRWDNIDEWKKHSCVVSITYSLFSFVTNEYCIRTFNSLRFKDSINTLVSNKIIKYGLEQKCIHFRNGDLIKLLSENESSEKVLQLTEKVKNLHNKFSIFEYDQLQVDRNYNHMLDSISDLLFLSKHTKIIGYCPYSYFSSWVFLLSSSFIDNKELYPIFNFKVIDLVLLE